MPSLLSDRLRASLDNSFADDWARQRHTAEDVLQRLQTQEGVVLADLSEEHGVPVGGIDSGHVARLVERAVVRVRESAISASFR